MKIDSLLAGASAEIVGLVPDRRDTDTVRSAYEDGISDGWNECRSELIRRIASLTHPPVADAALVRDAERFRALAKVVTHIKVSYAEPNDCMDDYLARMADAALNQRGGGVRHD